MNTWSDRLQSSQGLASEYSGECKGGRGGFAMAAPSKGMFAALVVILSLVVLVAYKTGLLPEVERVRSLRWAGGASTGSQGNQSQGSFAVENYDGVRVLCLIKTAEKNLATRARAVNATWGQRCDVTLFVSDHPTNNFTVMNVTVPKGRENLTDKITSALDLVHKDYLETADWFFTTDDDCYVIVENLRKFLSDKDTSAPVYYGHKLTYPLTQETYPSGGAGYVLSKEALRRFAARPKDCITNDPADDDVQVGRCLNKLGVQMPSSLDVGPSSRFNGMEVHNVMRGTYPDGWVTYDPEMSRLKGRKVISRTAITFHYTKWQHMYTYDMLLYHLRPKLHAYINGDRS